MRGLAVGIPFILALIAGLWTLYFWVPGFKAVAIGTGRALSGPEILLIRVSDFVVIYSYTIFPAALAACVAIGCMAFNSDHESPEK